jgi:hypothetical protein
VTISRPSSPQGAANSSRRRFSREGRNPQVNRNKEAGGTV